MIVKCIGQFQQQRILKHFSKILTTYINGPKICKWYLMWRNASYCISDMTMHSLIILWMEKSYNMFQKRLTYVLLCHMTWNLPKQCVSAITKASMTLGMIKRHIVSRGKNTIMRLYQCLGRPKPEYCIQSWNPSLIKDIELLEKMQHRATKLIPEISHLPYHDRQNVCNR